MSNSARSIGILAAGVALVCFLAIGATVFQLERTSPALGAAGEDEKMLASAENRSGEIIREDRDQAADQAARELWNRASIRAIEIDRRSRYSWIIGGFAIVGACAAGAAAWIAAAAKE